MKTACALAVLLLAPAVAVAQTSPFPAPAPHSTGSPDEIQAYCAAHLNGDDARQYCVDLLSGAETHAYCMWGESGGWTDELVSECATEHVAEMVARDARKWFARKDYEKGLPAAEARTVDVRGIPCNRSSYVQGDRTFEEFWYCVGGVRNESFTFLNGKLYSHFDGGNPP